ncbi:hypothetical protein J6590_086294 [Homalodisca vitripennis]|nr:hypothetical protein J6590_086294 [Homalodisca vitripennis]
MEGNDVKEVEGTVTSSKKKLRAEGKSYKNNRDVIVPEKQPPTNEVTCRCIYQCRSLTFDQKLNIFNQFYELRDNIKQSSYLMGNLSVCGVKRQRHGSYDDPAQSRRQANVFFTDPDGNGNHIQVCKQTFKEIHTITRPRDETLVKAKTAGDVTYVERRAMNHCQVYYLRQLSCFNLGLHMADNNQGFMFVWHEGKSGRGGSEIASCILRVCNDYFDEINHKYVVSGHSYLSCDRDFALIDKREWVKKCEVPLGFTKIFKKEVKKEDIQGLELRRLEMEGRIKPENKEDLRKFLLYLKEENKLFYQELPAA